MLPFLPSPLFSLFCTVYASLSFSEVQPIGSSCIILGHRYSLRKLLFFPWLCTPCMDSSGCNLTLPTSEFNATRVFSLGKATHILKKTTLSIQSAVIIQQKNQSFTWGISQEKVNMSCHYSELNEIHVGVVSTVLSLVSSFTVLAHSCGFWPAQSEGGVQPAKQRKTLCCSV